MLGWFLSLFRRRRPREASPIREEDAYARSYGERSGEIVSVARVEPKPIPRRTGDMTGELLRRAFETRLDARPRATRPQPKSPPRADPRESSSAAGGLPVSGPESPPTRVAASARARHDSPLAP